MALLVGPSRQRRNRQGIVQGPEGFGWSDVKENPSLSDLEGMQVSDGRVGDGACVFE